MSKAAASNSTRGIYAGGKVSPATTGNVIDFITIATRGNTQDFGDLSVATDHANAGASSPIRMLISGGGTGPNAGLNNIQYITISTQGNSVDFGDRTNDQRRPSAVSNANGGL